MEKITSKRFNPHYMISRRMVISMPNLQDIKSQDNPIKNSLLRRAETERGKGGKIYLICTILCALMLWTESLESSQHKHCDSQEEVPRIVLT